MRAVSRDDTWTEWCAFFLKGIQEQANENANKARKILALYGRLKKKLPGLTHSQYAMNAVDFLFRQPVFSMTTFISHAQIPSPTAKRIINLLRDENILYPLQEGRGRRAGIYAFSELLGTAEGIESP